jgi:hypothetical protein
VTGPIAPNWVKIFASGIHNFFNFRRKSHPLAALLPFELFGDKNAS